MKVIVILIILLSVVMLNSKEKEVKYKELSEAEKQIIERKGTEAPFSGEYWNTFEAGIYKCKRCDSALYESSSKFSSNCGWPSFDDEIEGAVTKLLDTDGRRTEILCSNCGAHLGHVFTGEGYTDKDTRHCVNSLSMSFEPKAEKETAYIAGGCFWGVEFYMQKLKGVISADSGYMGGDVDNPDYYQVGSGNTGHAEAVRVVYNSAQISYEEVIRKFFEIHDPTQYNRQGPDYGRHYRSAIFYADESQEATAQNLIEILQDKGYKVVTELKPAKSFWKAENYHQDYYQKKGGQPYCHRPVNRFDK